VNIGGIEPFLSRDSLKYCKQAVSDLS